ncbi:MAG TPA: FkbM family methyltransferase [Rubricoccaceae bacterium]|jgi:FkbM family methyltransferase
MDYTTTLGRRTARAVQFAERPRLARLHRAGLSVDQFVTLDRPWFRNLGIGCVVDIGANVGYFAKTMRAVLPEARIVAFEPIPSAFAALRAAFADDARVTVHNVALGRESGTSTFHVNRYSDSSSIRPMTDVHRAHFPFTDGVQQQIEVRVEPLDHYADAIGTDVPTLVKVDVQGFEDEVLAGGHGVLARAALAIVEVSFAPLYDGAPAFEDILATMSGLGLRYGGNLDQLRGPADGAILQCDALFFQDR